MRLKNQGSSGSWRLVKYTLPRKEWKAQKGDLKPAENRVLSSLQSTSSSSSENPQDVVFINHLRFFSASLIFQPLLPFTLSRRGRPIVELFLKVSSNQACPGKSTII